jgi:transglutaminase-like putative cysteine protease
MATKMVEQVRKIDAFDQAPAEPSRKRVGVAYQIPRNSLALLMVAQVVVILPLASHISLWIVGVALFCGYWRMQVYLGRRGYPANWVKALLVVASCFGVVLTGVRLFSLEAATSLMVLAFALKLVEMKSRRDAYVVIFLSYFVIATAFLFDQSMTIAAYELVAAVVVTAAMVGMNQLQTRVRPGASMWTAAGLVFQALPLTLVLFLLFPRVAPLWTVPIPSSATTGLSDRLTPGDIANLSQSEELAFRAVFEDEPPASRDLYWRGLVYSNFENGTWSVARDIPLLNVPTSDRLGLGYQVFMEPSLSNWLYALDTPISYSPRIQMLGDYRLINPEPVMSVLRYRVVSDPELVLDPVIDERIRLRETYLPEGDNPRLRAYAKDLLAQAGSPERMVNAMLQHIRSQSYHYTLQPPLLERQDSIDQFWFDTRRGFCTHYAGAMVFALRAAGIPARMVGGYQGGQVNELTGHVVVRQYQAHSWVEVWYGGRGWTRVDPTGAVAPARVESGLGAALSQDDRAALSFMSSTLMGDESTLASALQFIDSLEYRWNLWVIGYDSTVQAGVLKRMLGGISPARIGLAILIGGGLSLALVALALFWRRRPRQRHPVERLFAGFSERMARQGIARNQDESPRAFVERLSERSNGAIGDLGERLEAHLYDPDHAPAARDVRRLKTELRKLRFRLAFGTPTNAS